MKNVVFADAYRFEAQYGYKAVLNAFLRDRTYRPILSMRLVTACRARGSFGARLALPLLKFLHRRFCAACAIDFSHLTAVGPGFRLTHAWGTVISPYAVIGANCTVFHGVTIGQKDTIAADGSRSSAFPRIGDSCWIGPGAILVGGIHIGDGAIVAGGAVVVRDVPSGSVVAGNPARIVREGVVPDVYNPAPVNRM